MNKKITLPENISEITLDQFQRFNVLNKREDLNGLDFHKRIVSIFTDLKYKEIGKISSKDYTMIVEKITTALNTDCKFERTFKLGEQTFGFVPNLDKILTAEYVDLSYHGTEVENLHKIMAILFRPVIKMDKYGNYKIAPYSGTEMWGEQMKQTPMNIVNGALGFFLNLANELKNNIRKSLNRETRKAMKQQTIS